MWCYDKGCDNFCVSWKSLCEKEILTVKVWVHTGEFLFKNTEARFHKNHSSLYVKKSFLLNSIKIYNMYCMIFYKHSVFSVGVNIFIISHMFNTPKAKLGMQEQP